MIVDNKVYSRARLCAAMRQCDNATSTLTNGYRNHKQALTLCPRFSIPSTKVLLFFHIKNYSTIFLYFYFYLHFQPFLTLSTYTLTLVLRYNTISHAYFTPSPTYLHPPPTPHHRDSNLNTRFLHFSTQNYCFFSDQ